MARLQTAADRSLTSALLWFGAIGVPCLAYTLGRPMLRWAFETGWIAGLALALSAIALNLLVLVGLLRSEPGAMSARLMLFCILSSLLLSMAVFASVSFALHADGVAKYSCSDSRPCDAHRLADLYGYEFIDMIPGLEAWDRMNVARPVKAENAAAGLPIVLFRIAAALPILFVAGRWLGRALDRLGGPKADAPSAAPSP